MKIRNFLPSECNDSTPLIEVRSFERRIDEIIEPLYLKMLGLYSQVPKGEIVAGGSGSYGVDGYGLRIALADKKDGGTYLIWDTEYSAIGILPFTRRS
jgi:hypothetical protein